MADVRSIRIRRFKLLEDVALDLAPAIVLVGANNAGKSSVLQALHFATSVAQSARLAAGPSWQGDVYGVGFRPEQLIYAIMLLQEKIKNDRGSFKRALNLEKA